ncbi:class I SAM-dependent methyltransferase [Actinokineospora diospyrosa]|uniref:Methyltransferase domain-containing protein n=1 Tax=Actinokineospora diospyrosa TaxID=103728 RepID=A0ABT1I639_9PSEU|nr:class I SAM-dependent methyltransferase [Actinokineospora diospyrosa]MCP2268085.1 Methyltransferase domain-containing protein [Actinokineospora diospyrosa]
MGTDWRQDTGVADGFDAYDDLPERVLGYPEVFRGLRLDDPDVRTVLDYGCGPGKVALRAAGGFDVDVVAVDISERMLRIAKDSRPHPRVDYHHVESGKLGFLPDGAVDAAMSCYVFINIGDLDAIRAIAAEVHRVLRPGGRYAVLDTNPDTTGVEFATFRSGDPGASYTTGQRRRVLLNQPGGGVLELSDHHWPRSTYGDVLIGAGFAAVEYATPLLDPREHGALVGGTLLGVERPAEAVAAPFLIATGVK